MSGTSLDGVDAIVLSWSTNGQIQVEDKHSIAFDSILVDELLALNQTGANEIDRSYQAANRLATYYANAVNQLLNLSKLEARDITAIGCHGQTIRHRPDLGYTVQIGNAALLAELTGITVISDFRSRDVAAGGEGAPLVPAFHQSVFSSKNQHRVIVNIGGISNLSNLPGDDKVTGFDCGPGNVLMDVWTKQHLDQPYDKNGAWASSGKVIPDLLDRLLDHPFFVQPPPKSTGRDLFSLPWLKPYLSQNFAHEDVQATLLELTAASISQSIISFCHGVESVYLCGGGAYNQALKSRLSALLSPIPVHLTDDLGIEVQSVEAAAFAWLAHQTWHQLPGNLPAVTGAKGLRILGAIHAC